MSGGYIYQIYKSIDEEKKQELLRSVMESKATNPDYKTLTTLERSDIEFMRDAEFIIFSDFTTSSLLEMAGDKLLLNFGEIIGIRWSFMIRRTRSEVQSHLSRGGT